jgi:hypothetical protein
VTQTQRTFAATARLAYLVKSCPALIDRKEILPGCDMRSTMFEVVIIKRSPTKWEWRVCDRNGNAIMKGWEHSRRAAKYKGDRALFLLLAAGNSDLLRPR